VPVKPSVGRIHVITDATLQDRFSHVELARLAAAGGADAVQFREKRPWTTRSLVDTAAAMRRALEGTPVGLVVDDRVDVALAAGVRAVHLGRDDLDVATARRIIGADALVGGTANSLAEALRVAATDVDYLGVGPVFGTGSKTNPAPRLGLDGFRAIAAAVSKPVIAIGNVTADRVGELLEAGAHGVAVIAAVAYQADPEAAAREFREAVDAWLGARVA
jgi:thiamine-phosphate pyrophosphorylase